MLAAAAPAESDPPPHLQVPHNEPAAEGQRANVDPKVLQRLCRRLGGIGRARQRADELRQAEERGQAGARHARAENEEPQRAEGGLRLGAQRGALPRRRPAGSGRHVGGGRLGTRRRHAVCVGPRRRRRRSGGGGGRVQQAALGALRTAPPVRLHGVSLLLLASGLLLLLGRDHHSRAAGPGSGPAAGCKRHKWLLGSRWRRLQHCAVARRREAGGHGACEVPCRLQRYSVSVKGDQRPSAAPQAAISPSQATTAPLAPPPPPACMSRRERASER